MPTDLKSASLLAAGRALLVRFIYAVNGIVLTYFVNEILHEPRIFLLNLFLIPSAIEAVVTLKYKRKGEWTWFIPSVFIYLLWVVPSILAIEFVALDFRAAIFQQVDQSFCPSVFYEHGECRSTTSIVEDGKEMYFFHGTNITVEAYRLSPQSHDMSRHYSKLFQQIMMLIIIFGRWMAPKGDLSHDQLSSLLLGLIGMTLDMLELSTDSLTIETVACNRVYACSIIFVWCFSLLQIPMGLTAVRKQEPPVKTRDVRDGAAGDGDVESDDDSDVKDFAYTHCCCQSEIWGMIVSICMQDGPYLILRLYIIFSCGHFGETLIFFTAKNALVLTLESYQIYVVLRKHWRKRHTDHTKLDDSDVERRSGGSESGDEERGSGGSHPKGSETNESDGVSGSNNDVEAQLVTDDDHGGVPEQDEAFTMTEVSREVEYKLGTPKLMSNNQSKEVETPNVGAEKIHMHPPQTDEHNIDVKEHEVNIESSADIPYGSEDTHKNAFENKIGTRETNDVSISNGDVTAQLPTDFHHDGDPKQDPQGPDATETNNVSGSGDDVVAQLPNTDFHHDGDPKQDPQGPDATETNNVSGSGDDVVAQLPNTDFHHDGDPKHYPQGPDATETNNVSGSGDDVEAHLPTVDDHAGDPEQDEASTMTEVNSPPNVDNDTNEMESESNYVNNQTKEGELPELGAERKHEDPPETDEPSIAVAVK